MKKYYIPDTEAGRVVWFQNFKNKLPTYTSALQLTPAEISAINNDADMYGYIITQTEARKSDFKNIVDYKETLTFAPIGTPIGPVPMPEVMVAPTAVPSGIFTRLAKFVKRLKGHINYTSDIGSDLKIIGDEITFDPAVLKPVLKIKLNTGGHPVIKFKRNKTDRLNLYVDRRDGQGLKFLVTVSKLSYTDMHQLPGNASSPSPAPTPGTIATVWDYKGVYVIDDEEVGAVSDLVSITVGPGIV